jgi:hypothetical protein
MERSDDQETNRTLFVEPTRWDILHGRSKVAIHHTGNVCFRALVCSSLEFYETLSSWTERNAFYHAIFCSIRTAKGRFLRRAGGGWDEMDMDQVRVKIRHAFRDMSTKTRKKQRALYAKGISRIIQPYFTSPFPLDWKGFVNDVRESTHTVRPQELILETTDLDILHGRDKSSIYHIGNLCFRTVIGYSLQYYELVSTRSEKNQCMSDVVHVIQNSGGRFLHKHRSGGGWEQDDIQKAKQTAGQAVRDALRKPELIGTTLRTFQADFLDLFKTPCDFDWRGMVERAQRLSSEMNKSTRVNTYVSGSWEEDFGDSSSDSSLCFHLSSDELSIADDLMTPPFNLETREAWKSTI